MVSKYSRVVLRGDILTSPLPNGRHFSRPGETNNFSQILLQQQEAVGIRNKKLLCVYKIQNVSVFFPFNNIN